MGVCDSQCDSLSDALLFFLFFCIQVRVVPVHPALQLKVQFSQMALPTPLPAQAPAISPAQLQSRFTPSNPVP